MEQNTTKFRFRFNLFDIIVLVVALVVGAVILFFGIQSKSSTGNSTEGQIQYTIVFQKMSAGASQLIQAGDLLQDTVKNYKIGQVVSVEVKPAEVEILNQETQTYETTIFEGYEDAYVTVSSAYTDNGEKILLDGGYDILVGQTCYVRGPGYMGSGPVVSIERGEAQ